MRPMSTDDGLDGCPHDPEFEERLREFAAETWLPFHNVPVRFDREYREAVCATV